MGDPEGQNMHGGSTPSTVAKNVSRIQVKEDDYYEDDGQTHDGGEQDLDALAMRGLPNAICTICS